MKALQTGGSAAMDRYIAEMDEADRIAAVWIMKNKARGPSVFDPKKHILDPKDPAEFFGAPKKDIVNWLDNKIQKS